VNKRALGAQWEQAAKAYLIKKGYRITEMNYRCRQGEIDLIGYDAGVLCFIEVKYRTTSLFGSPGEAVTRSKQHKLMLTARQYMYSHGFPTQTVCRFDVVLICGEQFELVKNAFDSIF
jgi:putative endonuclease